ncbi:LegC family aminotransferase [Beggiatoa leptomitoformis]|uniref:GDP-perosamine synthase n=1 Tax=Beggiatoa leptomitoformis TaxID=288004 RepID=A0A2N9YHG3_9GAMM|nr:LegC family aminotransferase [Beggiatoa leptomitoformis]ALG67810.1 LegC family aminotransferase [Beggiatoa leptomitoformis]AUI69937.1 LegC family aminotransferase [Beggiatoa leptomitoformis]
MALNIPLITETLKTCLPQRDFIALHEPQFKGREWEYVKECLDTGWVSSVGKFVDRFEQQLTEYTDINHAIATVNGTAALHICLLLAGVQTDDEILTPALTFIASTNAIAYCRSIPHFVDCDEHTLGVDPIALADYLQTIAYLKNDVCYNKHTHRPIRALLVMHTFGHPVALDPLQDLCQRYHLTLIEDAAEGLGSYYKGQHVGHHGKLSALSFNGNKVITTGGGGAILTNDATLAKQAKHLTTTAKIPHAWRFDHDQLGYNYRLPNINAALGCAQLEQLPNFLNAKRQLAHRYQQAFAAIEGVHIFCEPADTKGNYWLNALLLDKLYADQQTALLTHTNQHGIMTRPAWTLQHKLPMYQTCPRMALPIAESLEARLINIPSGQGLLNDD